MFEGGNKNLAAYRQLSYLAKRQQFQYDHTNKNWHSDATGNILGFDWDNWLADDTVGMYGKDRTKDHGMRWDIFYCKDKAAQAKTRAMKASVA